MFFKEPDMQYVKDLFLGFIVLVIFVGCSGFTLEIPLEFSAAAIVIPPPPEPQPILMVPAPAPAVIWYQTSRACCYVLTEYGWRWHYHYWHHHHHHGRPHFGYTPGSAIPQHYVRPPR